MQKSPSLNSPKIPIAAHPPLTSPESKCGSVNTFTKQAQSVKSSRSSVAKNFFLSSRQFLSKFSYSR
ncbi:hypothetical protein L873DRAFT_632021 [Choiromyces venosus 120613-1]|uniref:Uncharacterized protein n=1 Tax=Choiromyces venosus 120613-1 TaxID=1336337 RepID=A0A3N4K6L8_9PEZI|nr:hypothetical protein L873DRAFT_632021 [Choiromyces venosus 120613-1]